MTPYRNSRFQSLSGESSRGTFDRSEGLFRPEKIKLLLFVVVVVVNDVVIVCIAVVAIVADVIIGVVCGGLA